MSVTGNNGQLKDSEDLFMEVARALSLETNETKKAALAQEIFGRSGQAMLPMLRDGEEGLLALMEEAKRLGLIMSKEDAKAAADLKDAWTRLWSAAKMGVARSRPRPY